MTSRQHSPSSGSHLSRALKRAAGILALFLLVCALVPPLVHKTVTEPVPITGSPGERVAAVDSNREAMLWRLRLIRSAQESLILSTFDLRPDETGLDILAALQEAADRGVRIQILADGICGAMYLQSSAHFRALAAMPNVEARFYNPINLLKPWALNYRMHDKYLIVDNHAYLLGGRNTYDLFLREDLGHYNIDRDVLVYVPEGGGSLEALRAYFDSIWSLGENRVLSPSQSDRVENAREALRQRAGKLEHKYPKAFCPIDYPSETIPARAVSLLANPPHPGNKEPLVWDALCKLMQQGEQIRIQTPYIICGRAMYRDLAEVCAQVQSLRIMTNAPEGGANPFGCADFLNQKGKLLHLGTETLEWLGGQSLHTKTVLIDDHLSVVGSFNMDMRSAYLDTELMVVIDCPQLNKQLRESFDAMSESSRISTLEGDYLGQQCPKPGMPPARQLLYGILRILLWPVRHLL